jgi:hypothetical protein
MDRHARQVRLAEVGERGQARIRAATVDVRLEGAAGEVAARYLAGAGVGRLRVRDARAGEAAKAVDPAVVVEVVPELEGGGQGEDLGVGFPAARDLARGATAALEALRAILGTGDGTSPASPGRGRNLRLP